jgi:hypothetical protein
MMMFRIMSYYVSTASVKDAARLAAARAIARELRIDPNQPGTARLALALADAVERRHSGILRLLQEKREAAD